MRITPIRIWIIGLVSLGAPALPPPAPIGTVVSLPPHIRLAAQPGERETISPAGSPALVIGRHSVNGGTWLRVLAADGTSGWTARRLSPGVAVEIGITRLTDDADAGAGSNHSPDDPSPMSPLKISGRARITGASRRKAVASDEQLGLPAGRNWWLSPWLQLRGSTPGSQPAWFHSSELALHWDSAAAPLRGMVRLPFTAQIADELIALAPADGVDILKLEEGHAVPAVSNQRWIQAMAAQLGDSQNTRDAVVLFNSSAGKRLVQAFIQGRRVALEFDDYPTDLQSAHCERNSCQVDVTSTYGDGYATAVWILALDASGQPRADRAAATERESAPRHAPARAR